MINHLLDCHHNYTGMHHLVNTRSRHNDNDDLLIPKPPYIVFLLSKNIFKVPFSTFSDGFDLAICIFLCLLWTV